MSPLTSENKHRWKQAQQYEANWWESNADIFDAEYLKKFSEEISNSVAPYMDLTADTKSIEIGAGPVGIVPFLMGSKKVATDPLNNTFADIPTFKKFRKEAKTNGADFVEAKGEDLPFDDHAFDLYLTDNVLDHVEDPNAVLAEAKRVLKKDGIAYIRVHVYHFWGRFIRWLMEQAVIDKGHPHTFSSNSLKAISRQLGFEVLETNISSFWEGWKRDFKKGSSGNKKALIQAILGVTRADFVMILKPAN